MQLATFVVWVLLVASYHSCVIAEFLDFYVFGDENQARFNRFDNVSTLAEIRTVDNEICEDDENFEIQINIDPVKQPRVTLLEPTTLQLTIEDDDTGEWGLGRDKLRI